jgi:hypothetical protein
MSPHVAVNAGTGMPLTGKQHSSLRLGGDGAAAGIAGGSASRPVSSHLDTGDDDEEEENDGNNTAADASGAGTATAEASPPAPMATGAVPVPGSIGLGLTPGLATLASNSAGLIEPTRHIGGGNLRTYHLMVLCRLNLLLVQVSSRWLRPPVL